MMEFAIAGSDAALRPRGRRRLRSRIVPPSALDDATRVAAFALFRSAYDGADRERFERDLEEKQLVILLHDRETSALKGFSTVLLQDAPGSDGRAQVVFSGDTVIDRAYWGEKTLQFAFARLLFQLKLRSPRRALYWFLISKGYRTYLLLANAFPHAVPRHDRADDPALRLQLDRLAVERFGAQYDARSGVIRYATPHEHVRQNLAPITDALLANPHVRYFVTRNTGHASGDELACLADVRLRDLLRVAARLTRSAVRRLVRRTAAGTP